MNCRNTVPNLSAFIDNELTLELAQQIQRHLSHCSSCRLEEQELRGLKNLLSGSSDPELDPNFEERLQRWIREPVCPRRTTFPTKAISLWVLAPASAIGFWVLFDSVSVTPAPLPAHHFEATASVARDQISDRMASAPLYGAPMVTAVDYVP